MTRSPTRTRTLPGVALALGGLVVLGLILYAIFRDRTPPLTREIFETRRRQWEELGIDSYSIDLTVQVASQPAREYELEVSDGQVTSFEMDGVASDRGEAYTVDGIFEIMDRELAIFEGERKQQGIPEALALRADFDDETGLPRALSRIAARNQSFFLRVHRFSRK